MNRADRMRAALEAALAPQEIVIADNSHRHAGHAGARPEGETHYRIRVVAAGFAGQNRLARSRAVHAALAAEFRQGLHALETELLTPEEAARG